MAVDNFRCPKPYCALIQFKKKGGQYVAVHSAPILARHRGKTYLQFVGWLHKEKINYTVWVV